MRTKTTLALLTTAALALGACGEGGSASDDAGPRSAPPATQATQGASWVLASMPENPRDVADAKADAAEGQTIVVRGRIGGRAEPITADSPVFTIMDPAVPHCGEKDDDHCPIPWDYCCETPESIRANSATVLLVDAEGSPLAIDPTTELEPLDEVLVVGTVAPRPHADVLTIRATGVHNLGQ
jgi:hypothetical protein